MARPKQDKDKKLKEAIPLDEILKEIYKNYWTFKQYVSDYGQHVIEHTYPVEHEDGTVEKITVTISFWDLHGKLEKLAPRKREAVFYNVIQDMRQRDAADIMGITTVSVGQYVKQAMITIAEEYFAENRNIQREVAQAPK